MPLDGGGLDLRLESAWELVPDSSSPGMSSGQGTASRGQLQAGVDGPCAAFLAAGRLCCKLKELRVQKSSSIKMPCG